jgi:hypothetical protein
MKYAEHVPNLFTNFKHRIANTVAEWLNQKPATVKIAPMVSGAATLSESPSIFAARVVTAIRLRLPMGKSDEP